ncbi:hypothetical protein T492DRAFT_887127 [Pavlovales sp. CCMP2436]|nr:hypothetical protein T492DRAFT_887127 [Pavlovales sp. CCMP2436]
MALIMDEVDGMGGGDRGGMAEMIQLPPLLAGGFVDRAIVKMRNGVIKSTRVPIICICNDRQDQKADAIAKRMMVGPMGYGRAWCVQGVLLERTIRVPFSPEDPPDRTPSQANKGATAAPARFKGDTARSGSIPGKHHGRPQPIGPASGRGTAGIRVPAA